MTEKAVNSQRGDHYAGRFFRYFKFAAGVEHRFHTIEEEGVVLVFLHLRRAEPCTKILYGMKSYLRSLLVCLAIYCLLLPPALLSGNTPKPKEDPVLGERIVEGAVFDGKLWLLGSDQRSGGLISLNLADDSRQVHFKTGVLDIEKSGQNFWILRQDSANAHEIFLSAWENGAFKDLAKFVSAEKDQPIALLNNAGSPTVLFPEAIRIFSLETHSWRAVKIKGKLRGGVQVSVASPVSGSGIYVGFNVGEWGGGLQRVDLQTGAVTDIERRDTRKGCSGPLNSDCDPVTGVIPDPANNDCVLTAVGLSHLGGSNGRILRACGEQVTVVFEKPTVKGEPGEWGRTEAFFGLAPAPDGEFWGITRRALYRFSPDGTPKMEYPRPKPKNVSGIYLSRELPGVIVLITDVNWAVSTSGYTPLIVPLEN